MLRRNLESRTARPAKHDGNLELPARHIKHLGSRVDYLVGGKNREIESHELNDRTEPGHCSANAQAGKSEFRYGGIDDSFITKLGQKAFRNLVCSLIGGDFLAHQENVFVAQHLFP